MQVLFLHYRSGRFIHANAQADSKAETNVAASGYSLKAQVPLTRMNNRYKRISNKP